MSRFSPGFVWHHVTFVLAKKRTHHKCYSDVWDKKKTSFTDSDRGLTQ